MTDSSATDIRILIVDDHAIVRSGLRMLLESHPGLIVVGEAANGGDARIMAVCEQPHIILLDVDLGPDSGLHVLPGLLATTSARVILLTGTRDAEIHVRAVRLGAMGVVLKDHAAEVLISAIEKVHRGETWLDQTLTARVLRGPAPVPEVDHEAADIAELTVREREIIALLAEGIQNKEVSQRLHITENTVRRHLVAIFSKLGVESRLELVVYAFRHGLAKLPR